MDYGSLKILKDTNFNQKPKKVAGNKIGLLSVIAIGFYTVSGGPYGLEQIVQAGGPFYALCGFSLFFVWAIPEALITAEMATALPETSGWVAWVTIAHGPYWGFQKGWLSWVSGVADNSLYPILFLDCLISLLKVYYDDTIFEHGWPRFFFILCATFGLTYVNYTGLDVIGWTSTILCPLSVTPFIIFCILGLSKMDTSQWLITPHNGIEGVNWTLFLNTFFWNINYWDSMSCFSNDIIDPSYNIPVGMGIAMLLVAVSIFLPILIGTAVSQDPYTAWTDGYFTKLGTDVGGVWLGVFIMVGATFSSIGQYEAEMSSDSFQIAGMADKGQLPKILGHRSVYGTPTYGILMSATGVLCLAWLSFSEIIQMLNILYCFAQVIEFVAFIQLRIRYGHVYRPYRIPLGTLGCVCMLILPTTFAIVMICISSLQTLIVAIVFILLGHVLYYILEYAKKYELCEFDVTSEEVDNSYRLVELCQQEQIQAQVSPCFSNDNSPLMRNLRI